MTVRSICHQILAVAKSADANASISAVAKQPEDGSTLVRIRASGGGDGDGEENSSLILSALRAALPLTVITLVENVVEGTAEAQILLPVPELQREMARRDVCQSRWAMTLSMLSEGFACAAVGVAAAAILARCVEVL